MSEELMVVAKAASRKCMEELEGPDDDIIPMLVWRGPAGFGFMPLGELIAEGLDKDGAVPVIMGTIVAFQAEGAAMVMTGWMVWPADGEPLDCSPSEHPAGLEVVTVMSMGADPKCDRMDSAPVIRYPDKPPGLAPWRQDGALQGRIMGRFGDAIHAGLDAVRVMPPEVAEELDRAQAGGRMSEVVEKAVRTIIEGLGR